MQWCLCLHIRYTHLSPCLTPPVLLTITTNIPGTKAFAQPENRSFGNVSQIDEAIISKTKTKNFKHLLVKRRRKSPVTIWIQQAVWQVKGEFVACLSLQN